MASCAQRDSPGPRDSGRSRGGRLAPEDFPEPILDVRPETQKPRLFNYKEEVWKAFHHSQPYLDSMKSQAFRDAEYERIGAIDAAMFAARTQV